MSRSKQQSDIHSQAQSHLQFQMWDQHLKQLNTIWNLEPSASKEEEGQGNTHFHTALWNRHLSRLNQMWHVPSTLTLEPPSSFAGKLLFPLKKLILRWIQPAIDSVFQQQNALHAELVQTVNSLVELTNHEAIRKLDAQREFNAQVVQGLNTLVDLSSSELERLRAELYDHFHTLQERLRQNVNELQAMLWTFDRRKEALEIEQIHFNRKLERIAAFLREQQAPGSTESASQLPKPEDEENYSYVLFEHLFRGDESLIKQRQTIYLPYFQNCRHVLDIGCGRGEFLELLHERGLAGYGIDTNQTMVQYCEKKGLQTMQVDVFSHLHSLPDESLDGIFAAQVVEHCAPEELPRLLQLCYDKLQPHASLVLETQNPQSLYALSNFYRDFSHNKPVHPDALAFLLKSLGFEDVRIEYSSPLPEGALLQEFESPAAADASWQRPIDALNQNIRQLNDMLYGYLDYAVIAKKIHLV